MPIDHASSRASRDAVGTYKIDDARDQRQVVVDPGVPAFAGVLLLGEPRQRALAVRRGLPGGGDQLAIEPALVVRPAAVLDGARPFLARRRRSWPPDCRRSRQCRARRNSRVMTRTASHNSGAPSAGLVISAALTVLSTRTVALFSSWLFLAPTNRAWSTASRFRARAGRRSRWRTDFFGDHAKGRRAKARNEADLEVKGQALRYATGAAAWDSAQRQDPPSRDPPASLAHPWRREIACHQA